MVFNANRMGLGDVCDPYSAKPIPSAINTPEAALQRLPKDIRFKTNLSRRKEGMACATPFVDGSLECPA